MAKASKSVNSDSLMPSQTQADWDAQGWAMESEPVTVAQRLETTISIRFDPESAALLRRAARLRGLTQSRFIRSVALLAAQHIVDQTDLPETSGSRKQAKL